MDWAVWKRAPGKTYGVLGDLPDTKAWPQWLTAFQERSEKLKEGTPEVAAYTSFLVEFLKGDKEKTWQQWKAFSKVLREKEVEDGDYQTQQLLSSLDSFEEAIAAALKIDEYKLTKFEKSLKKLENSDEEDSKRDVYGMGRSLQVPKLAQLTTKENAASLLKRVFAIKFEANGLFLNLDDETSQIAVEVLLAEPKLIQQPLWDLIADVKAVPLYEIYATKFPAAVVSAREKEDYSWQGAVKWIIASHLLKNEITQAVDVAAENSGKNSNDNWVAGKTSDQMLSQGKGGNLFNFYKSLLEKNPSANVWDSMIDLGARINRSGEVRQLAEALVAKQEQSNPKARSRALNLLADTALADDDVAKGLEYLRERAALAQTEIDKLLKTAKPKQKQKWQNELQEWGYEITGPGEQLQKIGKITKQEEVSKEGSAILRKWYMSRLSTSKKDDYDFSDNIEYFIENKEFALAEKYILSRIKSATEKAQEVSKRENYPGNNPFNSPVFSQAPELLVKLYGKVERFQDVVDMFKKWPFWGALDLSQLNARGGNLSFDLAKALEKTGDTKTAGEILTAMLLSGDLSNDDDAYAMLLRLQGQKALGLLDELYARDAFEERPLIWKGSLLLKSGKLAEAETVIRKAISIDPSDGEQGKGDRMRVYGVLADILEAKGDKEGSKLFRGVLKAIRIAEDADDVYGAGLTSRGIKQYNEALTHFADAYCIQSRLAKQLNDAGRFEEARVHYRRAFELMPDSFGRMESHCFGCEGVFSGQNAEGIAEQVFTNLIKETPKKPQVYYLLGYLRSAQDRDKEALELFQKAVQLDPDYINAWKKIAGFRESPLLTLATRDQASLALARLDPYGRHGGSSGDTVFDVKGMLKQLESTASGAGEAEGGLFELTATKQFIEKLVDAQIAEAGEELAKRNGMKREDLIKQMAFQGRNSNEQGPRSQIRQFLSQHRVLTSWQQYYQVILQSGR
ncbi:MAG: tetratricopeptide repeat protein [Verrucomicrobia bacterium]|nr:tetratricopeptide repeat protein [Verrucomicrobiota bacterium]